MRKDPGIAWKMASHLTPLNAFLGRDEERQLFHHIRVSFFKTKANGGRYALMTSPKRWDIFISRSPFGPLFPVRQKFPVGIRKASPW